MWLAPNTLTQSGCPIPPLHHCGGPSEAARQRRLFPEALLECRATRTQVPEHTGLPEPGEVAAEEEPCSSPWHRVLVWTQVPVMLWPQLSGFMGFFHLPWCSGLTPGPGSCPLGTQAVRGEETAEGPAGSSASGGVYLCARPVLQPLEPGGGTGAPVSTFLECGQPHMLFFLPVWAGGWEAKVTRL